MNSAQRWPEKVLMIWRNISFLVMHSKIRRKDNWEFCQMNKWSKFIKTILTIGISLVWLINGLFCKLLDFVPRHELIVSRILGAEYASIFTKLIGIAEILMVVWILSGIKWRHYAISQIVVVEIMNILEFILVPDLLLFGRFNFVFPFVFMSIFYLSEF